MDIEDNIDELYALHVAGAILCMRMWSYVTTAAAKAGGTSEKDFVVQKLISASGQLNATGANAAQAARRLVLGERLLRAQENCCG